MVEEAIRIEKMNDGYIKIKTKDGDIEIFYSGDRTCVTYIDIEGAMQYQFTLKDGRRLWLDGT